MTEEQAKSTSINQVLRRINHRAGGLYDFLMIVGGILNNVVFTSHGQHLTMLEIRMLTLEPHPGRHVPDAEENRGKRLHFPGKK